MGEYIRYRGEEIKIGTCEDLYYATYPKYIAALEAHTLHRLEGNSSPEAYAKPDAGFRFRFPFPDEDHLSLGSLEYDYSRGVPITLDVSACEPPKGHDRNKSTFQMEITQQKLVFRESDKNLCLALVWRDPKTRQSFRIEDDADIKNILKQIIKHHIQNENDLKQKLFYRKIAARILKGYRLSTVQTLSKKLRVHSREVLPKSLSPGKKR